MLVTQINKLSPMFGGDSFEKKSRRGGQAGLHMGPLQTTSHWMTERGSSRCHWPGTTFYKATVASIDARERKHYYLADEDTSIFHANVFTKIKENTFQKILIKKWHEKYSFYSIKCLN